MSSLYAVQDAIRLSQSLIVQAADVEVTEDEEGVPTLAIPMDCGALVMVTPEPLHPMHFAVLFQGTDRFETLARDLTIEQAMAYICRRLGLGKQS